MIREILPNELDGLLQLYTQLHGNPIPEDTQALRVLWRHIVEDPLHHIIVAVEEERIVSSCVCVIVPNLTHGQQPYALIENVIIDEAHRGKGLATDCLNFAREIAREAGCYKMMLLTGSKEESTHRFYQRAGYNANDKTAYIQWL